MYWDGGKDSGKKHADRLSALRGASISSKSLMLSVGFRKTSQAHDDDGLASNHRRSYTQEYDYVSYVLRRAGALQKGAVD